MPDGPPATPLRAPQVLGQKIQIQVDGHGQGHVGKLSGEIVAFAPDQSTTFHVLSLTGATRPLLMLKALDNSPIFANPLARDTRLTILSTCLLRFLRLAVTTCINASGNDNNKDSQSPQNEPDVLASASRRRATLARRRTTPTRFHIALVRH